MSNFFGFCRRGFLEDFLRLGDGADESDSVSEAEVSEAGEALRFFRLGEGDLVRPSELFSTCVFGAEPNVDGGRD